MMSRDRPSVGFLLGTTVSIQNRSPLKYHAHFCGVNGANLYFHDRRIVKRSQIITASVNLDLSEAEKSQWNSARNVLTEKLSVSEEDADKALLRGFGWSSQIYWRKKREKEVPTVETIEKCLDFLSSDRLKMKPKEIVNVLKEFPEILGIDLEKRAKANLDYIEKNYKFSGPRLKNSLVENPAAFGFDVDCQGDCAGECGRCWLRF